MLRDIRLPLGVRAPPASPSRGRAHIAYLPGEQVVGLGALVPKVVEILAGRVRRCRSGWASRSPTRSRGHLDTRGVLVVLDASHGCVTMRGGRQPEASTLTIAARGEYTEPIARAELIALIGASGSGMAHG